MSETLVRYVVWGFHPAECQAQPETGPWVKVTEADAVIAGLKARAEQAERLIQEYKTETGCPLCKQAVAEAEELRMECGDHRQHIQQEEQKNDTLRAQLAEAQRDAARLDWLQEFCPQIWKSVFKDRFQVKTRELRGQGETLRAAIDSAIVAQGGREG